MKFDRNVLQANVRRFDMTSYFQHGGHDVISRGKMLHYLMNVSAHAASARRTVQQRPPVPDP